jgi:signal transduction histidine kinase
MVDRSLDLYKMETGQYRLNPRTLDIVAICQRVLETERLNAKKKGVKILFESPEKCLCRGEELLCLSMLGNLVKNAVEASPASENIKVLVSLANEEDNSENKGGNNKEVIEEKEQQTITLEISNQGVIPADVRDSFF